jgi:hypothetical protein
MLPAHLRQAVYSLTVHYGCSSGWRRKNFWTRWFSASAT